jgi:hypothetical protein
VTLARRRLVGLLAGVLVVAGAFAAEAAADGELLEFLGSVDAEGEGWSEYLEGTDVKRIARPPAAQPPGSQPQQPPVRRQVQKP